MKLATIDKICCPFDKQDLQLRILAQDLEKNIIEGILSCTSCQRKYPIVYGVPIMTPDDYRQMELEAPIIERWQIEYGLDPVKLLPE